MDYRTSQHLEERAPGLRCDVLLVTATEVETRAVRDVFLQKAGIFERRIINDKTHFDLGVIGGARTFLVQSEMGAGGPVLIGDETSPDAVRLQGFLARNGYPQQLLDPASDCLHELMNEGSRNDPGDLVLCLHQMDTIGVKPICP